MNNVFGNIVNKPWRTLALLVLTLFGIGLYGTGATAATLNAQVDRLDVGLNETVTLAVTLSEQAMTGAPDFSALDKDFDILSTSQSNEYNSINGQVESYTRWQLVLMPHRAGKLKIPPFTFRGSTSQEVTINVTDTPQPQGAFAGNQDIYLETELNKQSVYVQQQALLTLRLYTNTSLSNIEPEALKLTDARTEIVNENQYQRTINGRAYIVVERTYAIFPQKSGALEIPSMRWDLQLGSRAQSLFDRFGNRQLRRLRTETQTLTVKPTPDNYPNGKDWIPAKKLTLTQTWSSSPDKFKAGEPITRKLILRAEELGGSQLPRLTTKAPDSVNIYPDSPAIEETKSSQGITTTLRQTDAIVPTKAGQFELPPVEVTWWNTQTQKVEKATLPAQKIFVYSNGVDLDNNTTTGPVMSAPANSNTADQPAMPANKTVTADIRWKIAAGVFALLWLLFVYLYVRLSLKQPLKAYQNRTEPETTEKSRKPLTRNALKRELERAADNPQTLKNIVLEWANGFWPDNNITGLNQITEKLPQAEPLREQLHAIDATLYGKTVDKSWQVDAIFNAISNLEKAHKPTAAKNARHLKPLYG